MKNKLTSIQKVAAFFCFLLFLFLSPRTNAQNYRSASSNGATSGVTTLAITKPTGTLRGDVMIAAITVRPNTATITAPTGWTLIRRTDQAGGSPYSQAVYWKAADDSEPSSYSWTFSSTTGSAGGITTFYNVNSVSPINVNGGQANASSLSQAAPSVTTTATNTMVVTVHSFGSCATWAPPAGMTEAFDESSDAVPNINGVSMGMNYVKQAASGATGAKTSSASGNADAGIGQTIALNSCSTPAAPGVISPVYYCLNATPSELTATGSNLVWGNGGSLSGTAGGTADLTTTTYIDGQYGPSTLFTSFATTTSNVTITSIDYTVPAWQAVTGLVLSLYNSSGSLLATSSTNTTFNNSTAAPVKITSVFNYTLAATGTYTIKASAGYGNIGGDQPAYPITEGTGTINITGHNAGGYRTFNNIKFTAGSNGVAPTPSTSTAGTTNYTVTQMVNGCVSPAATISVVVNTPPNLTQVPSSGLLTQYPFAGNAADESGNGNNGTLQAAPIAVADRSGNASAAYSFNGSTQFVSTTTSYSSLANFTYAVWFKTATNTGGVLIGFGNSQTGTSGSYDRHMYMSNSGQLYFGVYPGTVKTINTTSSYNDGQWHLAVASLSSSNGMKLYVDGVLQNSDATVVSAQNYVGWLRLAQSNLSGWVNVPSSLFFNGTLDDVLVYNRELTGSEVAGLYNSSSGAGSNAPLCPGQTLNLTAASISGATYSWTGPNGFTSNVQNPAIASVTSANAGVYTVTVTVNGCSSKNASVNVTLKPSPSATINYSSAAFCKSVTAAQPVTITGTAGGTFTSSPAGLTINSGTGAITPGTSTAGTYTVTYTMVGPECTQTATTTIAIHNVPSVSGTSTTTCVGGSTGTITASGSGGQTPYTYSLNAGPYQSSSTFTGLAAGTYTLNIQSSTGCISSATVVVSSFAAATDDQTTAGTDTWRGHVYDGTAFNTYVGQYTEAEMFNQNFGGSANCFTVTSNGANRTINSETFSVRYRMNSTQKGLYVVDLGSDDGSRLTVDGTMVYNNWVDQGFVSRPRVLMSLTGSSALLYEFYESSGGNQVAFQNLTLVLNNTLSVNASQTICSGSTGSTIAGDIYGTLPTGVSLSGTGYQWSYSTTPGGSRTDIAGATDATFTPSAAAAPFNTPGTYYFYRKASLSSTNNISPNPYVATNESNAATITVTDFVGTPVFSSGSSSLKCRGAETITYTATAANSTGITYSLDAPSLAAGNTVNPASGAVTFAATWSGTTVITASAAGCSGPRTATHTITIYADPTLSTSTTETCVGGSTGTITVTASGGTTPFTYSLNGGAYQASNMFNGLGAGTYTVAVKTNAGCINSASVTVSSFGTATDNQATAGTNTWIGHVYDGTNFNNYVGQYTEAETFNQTFGGNTTCFSITSTGSPRSIYTETFSIKYRMNSTKGGLYIADLGSDDGTRLTVDNTMVFNNWTGQAFTSRPRVLMSLTGSSSLMYEYYENAGGNQVVFQNFTLVFANTLSANTSQTICAGNAGAVISGDVYGVLPTGITLSGTGYQWSYSTTPGGARTDIAGATDATLTPSAAVAPFNTPGTYYVYRNAVLSSANNIAPNPYVATHESNAATIIVSAAPSATITYTGTPYCASSGTVAVNFSGTTGGSFSSTSGLSINATTGAINLASSNEGTYTVTYTIPAANGCGTYTTTTSVTVTAATWTGSQNNNWFTDGNWSCNAVPNAVVNVIIPSGLTNYPSISTGTATVKNLTIQTNGSLTVNNGAILQIAGSITNSGAFTAAGTIEMNGSSAQTIPAFAFAGNTVNGLTVNNAAGVTLGGDLSLTDLLTVTNGSLNTGGFLTLKSSALADARVAPVTSGAAVPINGNVMVERYIKGRRKYRLITSTVTTSASTVLTTGQEALSIWGNWQSSGINSTPNVGTIITGGSNVDGFDTQTGNASLFTYDDVNRRYVGFTSANGKNTKYTPLKAGVAYYMFVYGDRLNTITTSSPNNTVLKQYGTLLTGNQTYTNSSAMPLSNVTGRYTLIGNPFASPINWATVQKTNVANTYWGWDPNLSSTGGYVTVSTAGGTTIISPFSGSAALNQFIQPGQGFFVKTTAASPSLIIRERDKVSNYNGNAFRNSVRTSNSMALMAVNLQYTSGSTVVLADGAVAVFDGTFSNLVNDEDAAKMINSNEALSIQNGTELLSIDARQLPQATDTIFLNLGKITKPQYTLQIFTQQMNAGGAMPYLQDIYQNTLQPLSLTDTNSIGFTVDPTIPASGAANRFRIVFGSYAILPVSFSAIKATEKNRAVDVHWDVIAEKDIMTYEIERSKDGSQFEKAGAVSANTNSANKSYSWTDAHPFNGINYYRIRALDRTGATTYSSIAQASVQTDKLIVRVMPNPVVNRQVNIGITELQKGEYNFSVRNSHGQLVKEQQIDHRGGALHCTIYLDKRTAAGVYHLYIQGENKNYVQTIIIE